MKAKKKKTRRRKNQTEWTVSHGMRWEQDGTCYEQNNDGPWERRPDCDWGQPNGDLLFAPWIQEIVKEKR